MKRIRKLWWGIALLVLISPIGVILPEALKSGSAWGEWGLDEIGKMIGFIPEGMKKAAGFWNAPVPDYHPEGWAGKGVVRSSLGYIFSGALGVGVISLIAFFLGKFLIRKR